MRTVPSQGNSGDPATIGLPDGRRIHGIVDAGFGVVMDVFLANFTGRGGVGDTRTGRAWERDTTAVIFSCPKGLLAICVYRLAQAGGGQSAFADRDLRAVLGA
jgi:hypothetical protein